MEGDFWIKALAVGGAGTIAAFVFWNLLFTWLKLPIFQKMTKKQQHVVFIMFLLLVWSFSMFFVYIYNKKEEPAHKTENKIVVGSPSVSAKFIGEEANTTHVNDINTITNSGTLTVNTGNASNPKDSPEYRILFQAYNKEKEENCTLKQEKEKVCATCKQQDEIIKGLEEASADPDINAVLKKTKSVPEALELMIEKDKKKTESFTTSKRKLISLAMAAGRYDIVQDASNCILVVSPKTLFALQMKAYALYISADWDSCISAYKVVEAHSELTQAGLLDAYSMLTLVHFTTGQIRQARKYEEKIVEIWEKRYALDGEGSGACTSTLVARRYNDGFR